MSLRNITVVEGLPFKVNPFQDITDTLPSRSPDPEPVRTIEEITHASVHHSAVEGATIQSYANYHVNTLGWAHIGYHNVIKLDTLFQTNDWLTKCYHTSSHNGNTISFSISGDLSKRPITDTERLLLYAGLLTALKVFPNLKVENIWGHNEFPDNKTACPCIDMQQVRADIAKYKLMMQAAVDPAKTMHRCYVATDQHRYLYAQYAADPEGQKWLEPHLVALYDRMKELGLFFGSE